MQPTPPWPHPPHRLVLEQLFGQPVEQLGFTQPRRAVADTHGALGIPTLGATTVPAEEAEPVSIECAQV